MDGKVAELSSNGRLNEVQRGYSLQLETAEAKGEDGTIMVLGLARTLADCLVSLIREDAAKPEADKRLPGWTSEDVTERLVKPAAKAGLDLMAKIEQAAGQGQPYFKFQGGLDATTSMLSQVRRFEKELLVAHPWPRGSEEEDPLSTAEALYQRAMPTLEELGRKLAEERKLRWAALGSPRRP